MTKTLMMGKRGIRSLTIAQVKGPLWKARQRRSNPKSSNRIAVRKKNPMKNSSIKKIYSTKAFSHCRNKLTGKIGSTFSLQLPKRPNSPKVILGLFKTKFSSSRQDQECHVKA